jgi:hypothetical protein
MPPAVRCVGHQQMHSSICLGKGVLKCPLCVLLLLLPACVLAGDTVSNMDLGPALAAHKERADRDKDAIMTMVRPRRCYVDACACACDAPVPVHSCRSGPGCVL